MDEQRTIKESITLIRDVIVNHTEQSKVFYERIFNRIESFAEGYPEEASEKEILFAFYEDLTGEKPFLKPSSAKVGFIRKTGIVINLYRIMCGQEFGKKAVFFDANQRIWFSPMLEAYADWQQDCGKSKLTIGTRIGRIKVLFNYLDQRGLSSISDASIEDFIEFPGYLKNRGYTSQGCHNILYTVRDYLKSPNVKRMIGCNPMPIFSRMHTNKHERLPSYYSAEEIRKVLSSIDRETYIGRLAYAFMLLGCVYGIRSCDIKNLKLDSINWDESKISFVQHKTKVPVEFPLLTEVKFALLDYIKNARPKCDLPFVFLRTRPPISPFSQNNHLSDVIRKVFEKAGIDTTGKHCGLHSLRHSLATTLTEMSVPINEITTILGHSSMTPTLSYIWSDIPHLRLAAEEVPIYAKTSK